MQDQTPSNIIFFAESKRERALRLPLVERLADEVGVSVRCIGERQWLVEGPRDLAYQLHAEVELEVGAGVSLSRNLDGWWTLRIPTQESLALDGLDANSEAWECTQVGLKQRSRAEQVRDLERRIAREESHTYEWLELILELEDLRKERQSSFT